jgi:undecaprenyl-diphosphatase
MVTTVRQLDARVLAWLHRRRTSRLTRVMQIATRLGSVEVLAPLSTAVTLSLALCGRRRAAGIVALTASAATATNLGLKALFGRARPDQRLHLSRTSGLSFPSGHATVSAAIYGSLALVTAQAAPGARWLLRGASAAIAATVGASRVYLHVHYPSDVVAGWALGAAFPIAARRCCS